MNRWICVRLPAVSRWNIDVLSAKNLWIYGLSAVCRCYAVVSSVMRVWTGDILSAACERNGVVLSAVCGWNGVGLSATYGWDCCLVSCVWVDWCWPVSYICVGELGLSCQPCVGGLVLVACQLHMCWWVRVVLSATCGWNGVGLSATYVWVG